MRGYVERMEWMQKSGYASAGYREVKASLAEGSVPSDIPEPRSPERGICRRCRRNRMKVSMDGNQCADRHDCAKALLASKKQRRGPDHG